MAGDMCIYLSYKILRRDFRYWLRLKGWFSMISSFPNRIIIKIITDYTLLVQFRHPYELGGIYWSANALLQQLFCFVAVYLYHTYADEEEMGDRSVTFLLFDEKYVISSLWILASCLFLLSVICVVGFFCLMNRKYWKTFWDTKTGKQFVVYNFENATDDKRKFNVFKKHRSFYLSIEKDIKSWLKKEWAKWEVDKPEWFTTVAIAEVPADMLPIGVLKKMKDKDGRRDSIDVALNKNANRESIQALASFNNLFNKRNAAKKKIKKKKTKKGNDVAVGLGEKSVRTYHSHVKEASTEK